MALARLLMTTTGYGGPADTDRQWLFTIVPVFPILLLALRLWFLSERDGQTMLMLLQHVSPLGLLCSLLASTAWALPATLLVGRLLGLLLQGSAKPGETVRLPVALRFAVQAPGWLVALAVVLAALTWQLRFLPVLVMTLLIVLALQERNRETLRPGRVRLMAVGLPLVGAVLSTWAFWPAAGQAWATVPAGNGVLTAALLLGPPLMTPLLTGPVPGRFAETVVRYLAVTLTVLLPVVVGAVFLRTPVLPTIAVEVGSREPVVAVSEVVRGSVLTIDDLAMILLDEHGRIRFIDNDRVISRTLCSDSSRIPSSAIAVHGWSVEQTALEWMVPVRGTRVTELPCLGRSQTHSPLSQ